MATLSGNTIASTFSELLRLGNSTLSASAGTSHYIKDAADTNSALSINTTRVGIGTATPDTSLDVVGRIQGGDESSTNGATILQGLYDGTNVANVFGSQQSSGATAICFSCRPKDSNQDFISSNANESAKSVLLLDGDLEFLTLASGIVSIDSDVSLTSRFFIGNTGNVGIGTATPTYGLHVVGNGTDNYIALFDNSGTASTSHGIRIKCGDTDHADSDTHYILFEESDGGDVGELDSDSGNLALSDTSDYRLKENISLITGGLAKVNALKPSTFNYKKYPNKVHEGFIAHEVVDAGIGYAVKGDKNAVKDDGSIKSQLFAISNLIPQMVSAIQELSAKVDALENNNQQGESSNEQEESSNGGNSSSEPSGEDSGGAEADSSDSSGAASGASEASESSSDNGDQSSGSSGGDSSDDSEGGSGGDDS